MTDQLRDAAQNLLDVWPMPATREQARIELVAALAAAPSPALDIAAGIYRRSHQDDCRCEGCRVYDDPALAAEYARLMAERDAGYEPGPG